MATRVASRNRKKIKHASRRSMDAEQSFNVLVLATMSAGKSSLINALIGHELLPTANEATTACLTTVAHRPSIHKFRGVCYGRRGMKLETHFEPDVEKIRAWNMDNRTRHIELYGKFCSNSRIKRGLVLHDTPGPNNSRENNHTKVMQNILRETQFDVFCYVLNASQLATNDDYDLLQQVRRTLVRRNGYRVIFILNKVDLLDDERGEDLGTYIANTQSYLEKLGFHDPIIVPTVASAALSAKKALANESLTRTERIRLGQHLSELPDSGNPLLDAANIPQPMKRHLARQIEKFAAPLSASSAIPNARQETPSFEVNGLHRIVWQSGIGMVEYFLNQRNQSFQQ